MKVLAFVIVSFLSFDIWACKMSPCEPPPSEKSTVAVECNLRALDGSASVIVSLKAENEEFVDSESIDIGEYSYSFSAVYLKGFDGENDITEIFFFENNQIQDEVGSLAFEITNDNDLFVEKISGIDNQESMELVCKEIRK